MLCLHYLICVPNSIVPFCIRLTFLRVAFFPYQWQSRDECFTNILCIIKSHVLYFAHRSTQYLRVSLIWTSVRTSLTRRTLLDTNCQPPSSCLNARPTSKAPQKTKLPGQLSEISKSVRAKISAIYPAIHYIIHTSYSVSNSNILNWKYFNRSSDLIVIKLNFRLNSQCNRRLAWSPHYHIVWIQPISGQALVMHAKVPRQWYSLLHYFLGLKFWFCLTTVSNIMIIL